VTTPVVVQPGDGVPLAAPAGTATVKVSTQELTVLEFVCPPQNGPALHRHRNEDELWYVAEGDFLFQAGETRKQTSTGGMALGPRGLPHAFRNVGDRPGRLVIVTAPGGIDSFFGDLALALADGPLGPDALREVGDRHGIEFVGPPLSHLD
jgi:quercetin dioxygenase-like cupin family protein